MTTAVVLVLEDVHLDDARLRELGLARLRLGLLLWLSLRLALGLVCPGLGVLVLRCPRGHLVTATLKLRLGLSRDVPGARCRVRPSFVRGVVRFPAFPPGG